VRLRDKIAVVTGAAQGIGLACAKRLSQEGATVVLVDVQRDKGEAAAAEVGPAARFLRADVGRKAEVDALFATVEQVHGRVDVLVSNAGVAATADFLDIEEEDFDHVLRVNLKGAFLCGQAAARLMVRRGTRGAIVNMSSVNGVLAIPNLGPYVVSKGGLNQLTKVMALSLAPHGIRVNGVGPGTISTEMARSAVLQSPEAKRRILSRTPAARMGDPEEVAAVVAFLASDDASYILGQTIYVDGGRLALNYTVPVAD